MRLSERITFCRSRVRAFFRALLVGVACPLTGTPPADVAGITEPLRDATLSSSVAGPVVRIHVKEGDTVAAGDLLVELDSTLEELEVERRRLVAEDTVAVAAAKAQLALVAEDLAATRHLFEKTQSVSREELSQKELEHRLAEAEVERLRVQEAREELELKIAREQLRRRSLHAPYDGVVAEVLIEEGENCEARQPLLRLVVVRDCYLVVNLEAARAATLTVGESLQVQIPLGTKTEERRGTVHFIAPVVDAASGLREVKILFPNTEGTVAPGVAGRLVLPGNVP